MKRALIQAPFSFSEFNYIINLWCFSVLFLLFQPDKLLIVLIEFLDQSDIDQTVVEPHDGYYEPSHQEQHNSHCGGIKDDFPNGFDTEIFLPDDTPSTKDHGEDNQVNIEFDVQIDRLPGIQDRFQQLFGIVGAPDHSVRSEKLVNEI